MSAPFLHPFDITREEPLCAPLDYNLKSQLKDVDRCFKGEITAAARLTRDVKLFHVRLVAPEERQRFSFHPGQFVMVELPGFGEVPISICGAQQGFIELCIREAGNVTAMIHRAGIGAKVGIRGPFGTYFPMERMKGHRILLIAGGLGMAPLRAPIMHVTENRSDYGEVRLLYGSTEPGQLLFDYQYEQWRRVDGITISLIVDHPDAAWRGAVGTVTKLLEEITFPLDDSYAIVCGPPVMFKFVCSELSSMGMPRDRMFVSLERRMQCGMGKCCRCNVGSTYVCMDGPVFDFWTVMNLKEAI